MSTRAAARDATRQRIVSTARRLVAEQREMSLRAIARDLGMTAPALYRYAASHEDLVQMVALAVDADVADRISAAAGRHPADDPAARLVAAAVAFRQWALGNREEFALVFTNVDVTCIDQLQTSASTGMRFAELLFAVWDRYRFPVPALADLDPDLAGILRDPRVPADLSGLSEELHGLVWVLELSWARLYGTVTLEVYQHVDPRIVDGAHLFLAMVEDQAPPLGMAAEVPRLRRLIAELLSHTD